MALSADNERLRTVPVRKLELLEKGYDEVLDAVKHQDDKIGRLLTGLSFLTAATLAVAGLGGAQYVTRRFAVGSSGGVPLALVFLGIFVAGVIVSVSFLLGAFSTPLRLPGQRTEGKGGESTIYFFNIARQSLDDWNRRLKSMTLSDLEDARETEFVHETHNLAARAKYKHDRVSEATTIVFTSMLPLVLAMVLTIIAAAHASACSSLGSAPECDPLLPLPITSTTSFILGTLVALAVLVKYHIVISNQRQTQEDLKAASGADSWVAVSAAVVAGSLIIVHPDWGRWGWLILLPAGLAVGLQAWRWIRVESDLCRMRSEFPVHIGIVAPEVLAAERKVNSVGATLFTTATVALGAGLAARYGDWGLRFAAGVGIYVVLGLADLARSLLNARSEWRRARAKDTRKAV